ncbi:MAG: response regulator [Methylococcaceae bacterium]
MMKGLSAKFHIALGQSFIVVSILLVALYFELVPDRNSAIREGRSNLIETIAMSGSIFINQDRLNDFQAILSMIVKRNDDILSAGIRSTGGKVLLSIGDHKANWQELQGHYSTDTQLQVPIWKNNKPWGYTEIRCKPIVQAGWQGELFSPRVQLILFAAFCAFFSFYAYLSRMLRHLDPSNAVPSRVRTALDTLTEGLLVVDRNQYIVLANEAFSNIVTTHSEQLIGHSINAFKWHTDQNTTLTEEELPWHDSIKQGVQQKHSTLSLTINNIRKTFLVNCSPVLGANQKAGGVLISFQEITALEQKKAELKKSKEEAELANRTKSEFLANMSHEIRTPMNSILGFTEILKRGYNKNSQDGKKHLQTIHTSGKYLLDLINDILDLSKVEAGQLNCEQVSFSPHIIVNEVIQVMGVKAQEKGITLTFELDGEIPEKIRSDPSRLRQIITNLVGNAIKFTAAGGVKIVVKMIADDPEPLMSFSIIDTGIGIPQQKIQSIFDPFVQADSSVTREFGGTGLGLAISQKFVQALGGGITVTSDIEQGSNFTFTIRTGSLEGISMLAPEHIHNELTYPEENNQIDWSFPPNTTVLVVDDGIENQQLVKLVLEEADIKVETANNGQEGLDKVVSGDYSLILMDIQMPVMDGLTSVKAMREQGLDLPVLALTAHAMMGHEEESLAAGYSGYLTKPIDFDVLLQTLAQWLGGKQLQQPAKPSNNSAPVQRAKDKANIEKISPTKIDPEQSHSEQTNSSFPPNTSILVVDDGIENQQLVKLVLEEAGLQVETANNGQEGLDKAVSGKYALILMDIQMPVMDGLTSVKAMREQGLELPVLALTAHDMLGHEEESLTAGYSGFLTKPIDFDILLESLTKWLGDNAMPEPVESAESTIVMQQPEDTARIEKASNADKTVTPITSRLPNHNPHFREIIELFIEQLKGEMEAIHTFYEQGNYDGLSKRIHWLKGTAGSVGFDAFTEPAEKLQQMLKRHEYDGVKEIIQELATLSTRVTVNDEKSPKKASDTPETPQPTAKEISEDLALPAQLISRLSPNPKFDNIIRDFRKRLCSELDVMNVAWFKQDYAELTRLAHWIKGTGGTVGFDQITEQARHLEMFALLQDDKQIEQRLRNLYQMATRITIPSDNQTLQDIAET